MEQIDADERCAIHQFHFRLGITGQYKISRQLVSDDGVSLILSLFREQGELHPSRMVYAPLKCCAFGLGNAGWNGEPLKQPTRNEAGTIPYLVLRRRSRLTIRHADCFAFGK